jgi:hypothetical protein
MNTPSRSPRLRGLPSCAAIALAVLACTAQQQTTPSTQEAAASSQTEQPASAPQGEHACLDIRAALVKCKEGETMTHEGCPEPSYMQRCAMKPAQGQ